MPNTLKHDLRTPLDHIIGYCEMLLEQAEDLSEKQFIADLERIHFAGRRLLNVINDLFDPIQSTAYRMEKGVSKRRQIKRSETPSVQQKSRVTNPAFSHTI